MKKDINSQIRYNVILSLIGIILCIFCLIFEIVTKGDSIIFWIVLLSCNFIILIANLRQKEKYDKNKE